MCEELCLKKKSVTFNVFKLFNVSGMPSLLLVLFYKTMLASLSLCILHQQKPEDRGQSLVISHLQGCHLRVVFCLI